MMFHKNSPLVPMFRQGLNHFRENGIENELVLEWFGDGIEEVAQLEGFALTFGRVVLVLIIMGAMYLFSLFMLGAELTFKRCVQKSSSEDARH